MTTQHSRSPDPDPEGDEERTVATGRLTADGAFPPRFSLYALVQVLASTLIALIIREIRRAHLYRTDVPPRAFAQSRLRSICLAAVFGASTPSRS